MKELAYYKKRLEEERDTLKGELERIAQPDTDNPENWVLKKSEMDVMEADRNEAADRTEEVQIDSIVLDELETRYRLVLHALKKIDDGSSYGICEVSGKEIEEERLDANPAARTCKEHVGDAEKRSV